jgi:hypothetical protein
MECRQVDGWEYAPECISENPKRRSVFGNRDYAAGLIHWFEQAEVGSAR